MRTVPLTALSFVLLACIAQDGVAQRSLVNEGPRTWRAVQQERVLSVQAIEQAELSPETDTDGVSASVIRIQILLDRSHFSSGVIDGRDGENFRKAVAAFRSVRSLEGSNPFDDGFAEALKETADAPVLKDYEISPQDAAYRFTPDLPSDFGKLAKLNRLNFQTMTEMLAERFHMDERLLRALNPQVDFSKPGTRITVANVERSRLQAKVDLIEVDKQKGELRGFDRDGTLLVAYPATVGSQDVPSPSGEHRVKGIAWKPSYAYDPVKNFQQGSNTKRLNIPPGPNNPVGSVFIALTKPTYGIHGTPEPSKVDKNASHGCVRLTNWDVEELGRMVGTRTRVRFLD